MNPQTLRYYERRGILTAPERSPAGYRNYPESTVNVLRFIKRAQELGFSLADVAQLLRLADGGADSCAQARAVTAARRADLDRKIADLRRMRRCLAELDATCRGPGAGQSCRVMVQAIEDAERAPGGGREPGAHLCSCPQPAGPAIPGADGVDDHRVLNVVPGDDVVGLGVVELADVG